MRTFKNTPQVSEKEIKDRFDQEWWKGATPKEIVDFQLFQYAITVPAEVFYESIQIVLGRKVDVFEVINPIRLQKEYQGELGPPTEKEVLDYAVKTLLPNVEVIPVMVTDEQMNELVNGMEQEQSMIPQGIDPSLN